MRAHVVLKGFIAVTLWAARIGGHNAYLLTGTDTHHSDGGQRISFPIN